MYSSILLNLQHIFLQKCVKAADVCSVMHVVLYSSSESVPRYGREVYGWEKIRLFIKKGSGSFFSARLQESQLDELLTVNTERVSVKCSLGGTTGATREKESRFTESVWVCRCNKSCPSSEFWDQLVTTASMFSKLTTQPSTVSRHKQNRKPWLALIVKNQVMVIYNSRKITAIKCTYH